MSVEWIDPNGRRTVLPVGIEPGPGWQMTEATSAAEPGLLGLNVWSNADTARKMLLHRGDPLPVGSWHLVGGLLELPIADWPVAAEPVVEVQDDGGDPDETHIGNEPLARRSSRHPKPRLHAAPNLPTIASDASRRRPAILGAGTLAALALVAGGLWLFNRGENAPDEPLRSLRVYAMIRGGANISGTGYNHCGGSGDYVDFRPGGNGQVRTADGTIVGTAAITSIDPWITDLAFYSPSLVINYASLSYDEIEQQLREILRDRENSNCMLMVLADQLPPADIYELVVGDWSFTVQGEIGAGFGVTGQAWRGPWLLGG